MDVGLLPTTYPSESLPTIIIEYLCCGIPSVASDAGEIVNMLQYEGKQAGLVVPIVNGSVSVDGVKDAMQRYLTDKKFYEEHKANAELCYNQFDMDKCLASYYNIYYNSIVDKIEKQSSN